MSYKNCYDNIVKLLIEKGQIQPFAFSMKMKDEDYNQSMDLLNFLTSKCLIRFGYAPGMDYAVALTWTKLGIEQLQDETKCSNIFSEFKTLYNIGE